MGLFVSSRSAATRHGVFALEQQPPAVIKATGTGTACLIEQLPWGPDNVLTTPTDVGDLLSTIAPAGMTRTGSGYLACIRKAFTLLKFVRVLGSTAAAATAVINKTGPTALVTVTLKYKGTEGNNVVVTTSAASDGDANHFNISATVTGPSGTTTDLIENYNVSGIGADTTLSTSDLAKLKLIGSVTKNSSGVPILASTTCTGGLDGTVDATTYVGTQGSNDKGIAKLEGDKTIDVFFVGDPGNSLRAAVNAGIKAHADYMSDRVGMMNGDSGQTASAAQTDVASYRSERVVYCDPWVYIYDDVTATKTLVPSASFAAAVASQLSPSTSIAWKGDEVIAMLGGILDLEADRGEATSANTNAGIATFIKESDGGFTIEAGVVTIAPSTPAKKNLTRTRMGHYMARSMTKSLRSMGDAPNVPEVQQDIIDAVTTFLERLKGNAKKDPIHTPHLVDYDIADPTAANPQSSIDAGEFAVPIDAKTSSSMEKIFLLFNFGETVTVTSQ